MPETATAREIWIAVDGMPAALAADVASACARTQRRCVQWRGGSSGGAGAPALLVAALPRGAREIPEDAFTLVTTRFPDVPLLLLCDEPLTRPSVALQGGRVTLLGAPLSPGRLLSRLRALLGATPAAGGAAEAVPAARQGQLTSSAWYAAFGEAAVRVHHGRSEGLTALVPAAGRSVPSAAQLDDAVEALRRERPEQERGAALARCCADGVALVHLSADAREWFFRWPAGADGLWLGSPLRLPPLAPLAGAGPSASQLRMGAHGGDLVLAAPGATEGWLDRVRLMPLLAEGGPAVLDVVVARLDGGGSPGGLVVEVR